jgi:hypothetical protein
MSRKACRALIVALVLLSGCGQSPEASVPTIVVPTIVVPTIDLAPRATATSEPLSGIQPPGEGFGQGGPAVSQPPGEAAPVAETPAAAEAAAPTPDVGQGQGTPGDAAAAATIFPLTDDATSVLDLSGQGDMTNYSSQLSAEEIMEYYRQVLGSEGATERELLTVLTDQTFSMVFDGWPAAGGKAVVIQGTPLGPDTMNVNIRLESV